MPLRTLCALFLVVFPLRLLAQTTPYSDDWYTSSDSFVKIAVVEDGVYRVTGSELEQAGLSLGGVDPATLQLFENGIEVPLWLETSGTPSLQVSDEFVFVGKRNRGMDELWAFEYVADRQSSDFHSLFSDTTWYWLTWGETSGLRYTNTDPEQNVQGAVNLSTTREIVHREEDAIYYFGDSDDSAQPQYTRSEGFLWINMTHVDSSPITETVTLQLVDLAQGTELPIDSVRVRVLISSASANRHVLTLEVAQNGSLLNCDTCEDSADWTGYAYRTLEITVPRALLDESNEIEAVITSSNDFNNIANRVLIDWVEASYQRLLQVGAEQRSFTVPQPGAYRFQFSQSASDALILFNPDDRRRFAVPNSTTPTVNDSPTTPARYWITRPDGYLSPEALLLRTPQDLSETANPADYLIVTTRALSESANALAAYRSSIDGYNTSVVYLSDLLDQYDYGRPTPIAIRRFIQATQAWDTPPRFLMLWGDALKPENNQARRPLRPWEVPSFGYAPADPWFGMQLNGDDDWQQRLAIGRIPIRDNETGNFFLEKLGNYESSDPAAWQKRFLLLVGGRDSFEQALLQQPAIRWSEHAATRPTGMDTLWFFKQATLALDPSFRDSLSTSFKNGASWISYFGHSAADTWEIVTDAPEDYDNADRLPVVLSMGCNTGNFAGGPTELADQLVYGERLVLASLNGSIAHWGSSSASTISQPAALADEVHRVVFQDTTRILGQAFQRAKSAYLENVSQSKSVFTVLLQYGLIGDPATRIQIPDRPELQTSPDAITVLPVTPVPSNEKLDVDVQVRNWGLIPADSVDLQVIHQSPDQPQRIYTQKVMPAALETQASFVLPITEDDIGDNQIQVHVDPDNAFTEVDELNNTAEKTHTIFSTGIAPVAPIDFAIVPSVQPLLRTSLATSDTSSQVVVFELDTVSTFDSPSLQTFSTTTIGIIADWQVTTPLTDQQSYYWRARIDAPDLSSSWTTSRFSVDLASVDPGWRQQSTLFESNETNPFLRWDEENENWTFSEFRVDVRASSERGNGLEKGQILVNATIYQSTTLGFGMLTIDGSTGQVRDHASFPTYDMREQLEIRFDTDSSRAMAGLTSFLTNLNAGDYLFVRTRHLGNLSGPTLQPEIKALFNNLGSQAIDTLTYDDLWLFRARVGFPEESTEWVEPPGEQFSNEIAQDTSLFFSRPEGFTLSPPIGPSRRWISLQSDAQLDNSSSDVRLDILDPTNGSVLLDGIEPAVLTDLSLFSIDDYPYLQIRANLSDSSQQTTPQLTRWSVSYEPTPELALLPSETTLSADTVSIGASVTVQATLANLSDQPAPLATITYTLTDAANTERLLGVDTLRTIAPEEERATTFEVQTADLSGTNRLRLTLDQPDLEEAFTLNNVLLREFFVNSDTDKPQLEVFVDNEMLPNNPEPVRNLQDPALPFVNAQPTIEIIVSDENPFQLLNDTSLIQIQFDRVEIPFSDPALQFQPGTEENNEARVFYTPDLSGRDTTHTLNLRVFDRAGNEAEGSPYQVHFRVQTSFEIESLYPYPNPMHNVTTFAFQLRGEDVSLTEDFRIRIYTVSGRLIQEFDLIEDPALLEIPGLRIGWNKLRWDGRDADGDPLAPGVYLYKVFLRSDGREVSVNNSSSVEKLVVLR